MAYNNRMPVIARLDASVRDSEFIPINELKSIDEKMLEIIKLFQSTESADQANNIASKLRDVEYNLADALVFDEDGNIIDRKKTVDEQGNEIPLYGENSIYNMLDNLEKYYGEFVKLMGSDPNLDAWKIDLNTYFTEVITEFKNKITGVFQNSSIAAAIEAKGTKENDYMLNEAPKVDKHRVMRLNPDVASFTRTVNVITSEMLAKFIAFEIVEAEKDTLALEMEVQNGFMSVKCNIVEDKGKWHITKESVFGKAIDNKFDIYVYKYNDNGAWTYVFCLANDYPSLDIAYNFRINGILHQGFSFNASGLTVDKHNQFYKYIEVEDLDKPVYNVTYYTTSIEEYQLSDGSTQERTIYIPHEKMLSFEPDTVYYTRDQQFELIHSFSLVDGDNVISTKDNVVVENLHHTGDVKVVHLDFEVREALDDNDEDNPNDYVLDRPKLSICTDRYAYEVGGNLVSRRIQPKKFDSKTACAFGEIPFDIVDIKPGEIANTNYYMNKEKSIEFAKRLYSNRVKYTNADEMNNNVRIEFVPVNIEETPDPVEGTDYYILQNGQYVINDPVDAEATVENVMQLIQDGTITPTTVENYVLDDTVSILTEDDGTESVQGIVADTEYYKKTGDDVYELITDNPITVDVLKAINSEVYKKETETEIPAEAMIEHAVRKFAEGVNYYTSPALELMKNIDPKDYIDPETLVSTGYSFADKSNKNIYIGNKISTDFDRVYKIDLLEDETILGRLIQLKVPGFEYKTQSINDYIKKNLVFVNYFNIGILTRPDEDMVDILIIPDDNDLFSGDFYMSFAVNLSSKDTKKDVVYRSLTKPGEVYETASHLVSHTWSGIASDGNVTVAISDDGLFYSHICDVFTKLHSPMLNTREKLPVDSSWTIRHDTKKYFFIEKKEASTDHRIFMSTNGLDWKLIDLDILFPDMKGVSIKPVLKCINIDRYWILCASYGTKMLSETGLLELAYNSAIERMGGTPGDITASEIYNCPFKCADIIYNEDYYFAINVDTGKLVYGSEHLDGTIPQIVPKWTNITLPAGPVLTGDAGYDFILNGYDMLPISLHGSGKVNAANKGTWHAENLVFTTWKKSTGLPNGVGINKIVSCEAIYKNPNGSESSAEVVYGFGTDGITYLSIDSCRTWTVDNELGGPTSEVVYVGKYNEWWAVRNTPGGIKTKFQRKGVAVRNEDTNLTTPFTDLHGTISVKYTRANGPVMYHITDNTSGKIYYTTDMIKWEEAKIYEHNPFKSLIDIGDNVYGNTKLHKVQVNKGYDNGYMPSRNTEDQIVCTLNESMVKVESDNTKVVFTVDGEEKIIAGSASIDPKSIFAVALTNGDVNYVLNSETVKGFWYIKSKELDTGSLTKVDMDIFVSGVLQNSDGMFVYGKADDGRHKLYFLTNAKLTDNNYEFAQMFEVDHLDYIGLHGNEVVISTYDDNDQYAKYSYNPVTQTVDRTEIVDVTDLVTFNDVFTRNGEVWFINGSGSNPLIRQVNGNTVGVYSLRNAIDSNGKITTETVDFVKNPVIYEGITKDFYTKVISTDKNKAFLYVHGKNATDKVIRKIFIINFAGQTDSSRLIDKSSLIGVDGLDTPYTADLNSVERAIIDVIRLEIRHYGTEDDLVKLVVQEPSLDITVDNPVEPQFDFDFKVDEIYFDKETLTLDLKNYDIAGTDGKFRINSEKIAYGKAISSGQVDIIFALGQDSAVAAFNANDMELNVCKLQYEDQTNSTPYTVKLNPEYNNTQSVFIASGNDDNKVYILVYGKFPKVLMTDGKLVEDYTTSITTYKLFSVNAASLRSPTNEYVNITEEIGFRYQTGTKTLRQDVRDYILIDKSRTCSTDLELNGGDRQFIVMGESIVYKSAFSAIYWNTAKRCMESCTYYDVDPTLLETGAPEGNEILDDEGAKHFDKNALYVNISDYITDDSDYMTYMRLDADNDKAADAAYRESVKIKVPRFLSFITNRKHVIIRNREDFEKDVFWHESKFNMYHQTTVGGFRRLEIGVFYGMNQLLNESFEALDGKLNCGNDEKTKITKHYRHQMAFTPENSDKTIILTSPNGGAAYRVWDTVSGIFIQCEEMILYGFEKQMVYVLYRLDRIPDGADVTSITVGDPKYFTAMDTMYAEIDDVKDTIDGTMAVGTEPVGVTDLGTGISSSTHPGKTYVFLYNGQDFGPVVEMDPNTSTTNWFRYQTIIPSGNNTLLVSFNNKKISRFNPTNNTLVHKTAGTNVKFIEMLTQSFYGIANFKKPHNIIPDQNGDPYYVFPDSSGTNVVWKKVKIPGSSATITEEIPLTNMGIPESTEKSNLSKLFLAPIQYPIIRPPKSYDTFAKYNDLIDVVTKRDLPKDKALKATGSIVYNGIRYLIDGFKLVTDFPENIHTIKQIVFNIDKRYRIKGGGELDASNPGILTFNVNDKNNFIQKMNITVMYSE